MFRTLGIALALLALAPAKASAQDTQTLARGRLLVQRYCAGCHAVTRSGHSPRAGAPPFRELHERYQPDDLAESLAEGILVGHPAMPQMAFPQADVKAILVYIKSIQTDQRASADRAERQAGR